MKMAVSDGSKWAKAPLIGAGLSVALVLTGGVATPSMAEEGLDKDIAIIRACAGDIWRLCPDVLPERDAP